MQFFIPALSDWQSLDSGVATARGTDVIKYLNASASFSVLLTSKQKAWQFFFRTYKDFKTFFFSLPVFNFTLQIGSKNDFLPFTNLSWTKAIKRLFPTSSSCKRTSITSLSISRPVVRFLAGPSPQMLTLCCLSLSLRLRTCSKCNLLFPGVISLRTCEGNTFNFFPQHCSHLAVNIGSFYLFFYCINVSTTTWAERPGSSFCFFIETVWYF